MKSWKTTVLGVLTILAALVSVAKALLDGDPSTAPNFEALWIAITAGIGLIAAKDANVTGGAPSMTIKPSEPA